MTAIYQGDDQILVEHESLNQNLQLIPSGDAVDNPISANEGDEVSLTVSRIDTTTEDGYEYTGTCIYEGVTVYSQGADDPE